MDIECSHDEGSWPEIYKTTLKDAVEQGLKDGVIMFGKEGGGKLGGNGSGGAS